MIKVNDSDIAIISMACRFPDAENVDELWDNLSKGKSSIKDIPNHRWRLNEFYSLNNVQIGKSNTKKGTFLNDIKSFDPKFFGINHDDAYIMDPQQRILIELAYELIYSTKYSEKDLSGKKVAVYLGITKADYREYVQEALIRMQLKQKTSVIGVLQNMTAARISNIFDFQGPALTIDTACSSSLVALHLAKESILSKTSELAIVGGINLNLIPAPYLGMASAGALSSRENYHIFDQRSDGFFMGEGGGLILIKKLSQAIIDQDNIIGVIKGSGINNDGKSFSPMMPRHVTQYNLLEETYNNSDVKYEDINYIEAHGTGTFIGDAIESQTLIKAFKNNKTEIFLGSIKPNIGHLLSGAGIASIIKVLLSFQNRKIPPLINHQEPRTELGLEDSGFILNGSVKDFKNHGLITAGINAFGFGGTNAHVILQEYENKSIFKQFTPNYNKKEYWLDIDFSLDKKYFVEKNTVKSEKVFIPEWIEKPKPITKELPKNIITIKSTFYSEFQKRLLDYAPDNISLISNSKDISKIDDYQIELLILFPKSYQYLLKLFQEINESNNRENIYKITIITEQSILLPNDEINENTGKFLTSGLINVISSELTNIEIRHIDLDKNDSEDLKINQITSELNNNSDLVAVYRNNKKYIKQFNDYYIQLDDNKLVNENISGIKENGIYLITGASSGIALEIAKSILLKSRVNLVLVGRRSESEIKEWKQLINLSKNNNSLLDYFSVDISEPEEVELLFQKIMIKYGSVNGIIHAAGIANPELFDLKTPISFEQTLKPKVKGIELLAKQIEINQIELDFFITFSSISAVISGYAKTIIDYAVANYYLEQYCLLQQKKRKPFQVINWGPWKDQGMVSGNKYLLQQMSEKGIKPIETTKGLDIFWEILYKKIPHTIVANTDLSFKELSLKPAVSVKRKVKENKVSDHNISEISKNILNVNTEISQEQSLQNLLIKIVEEELSEISKVVNLSINDNLLDLGIDSLSAMEIITRLSKLGYKDLPFELIFENQTIKDISAYLLKKSSTELKTVLPKPLISEIPKKEIVLENEPLVLNLSPHQEAFFKSHIISELPNFSYTRQTINGKLDLKILNESLKIVLNKHQMLRSNFYTYKENGKLQFKQKIAESVNTMIEFISLNNSLEITEDKFVNQKFDLEKDLLIKVAVVEETNKTHLLILAHHIIFDGISMNIFVRDLWLNYKQILEGGEVKTDKPISNYSDYISYINNLKNEKSFAESLNWWRNYIQDFSEIKEIESLNNIDTQSKSTFFKIPLEIHQLLAEFIKTDKISYQFLFLTIYAKTLSQWFKVENLIINLAINGRSHQIKDINNIIGCFADTLPIYIDFRNTEKSIIDIAKILRNNWNKSKQYHNISSSEIKQLLKENNLEFSPFAFSFTSFNKEWVDNLPFEIIDSNVRGYNINTRFAMQIWEDLESFNYTLNYPDGIFSNQQIEEFNQIFLDNISENIKTNKLVIEPKNLSIDNFIIDSFLENTNKLPFKEAIIYQNNLLSEKEIISYNTLNEKSNLIAGSINNQKLKNNPVIAVIGTASVNTTIALMGILKCGGTYVPIEKDYPIYRIEDMLKIAKTDMVIITDDFPNKAKLKNINSIDFSEMIKQNIYIDKISQINTKDIAYIIFTSGSTGKPKGVPITYQALFTYLKWCINTFNYNHQDKIIQISSICFDASLRQILVPLITGATLFPLSVQTKLDIKELWHFIKENEITVWSSIPSLWEKFISYAEKQKNKSLDDLRMIKVGGENLSPNLVRRWQNIYGLAKPVVNLYGPTEATINTTYHVIDYIISDKINILPIGKPLPYYQCQIFDENSKLSVAGQKGELYISGLGITSGYLDSKERNNYNNKFFRDNDHNIFYKTGDIVSQNNSGDYIFHGRTDRQVKIRGFRIELEEIENILLAHPLIISSAVEIINQNGSQQLIAFVCLRYNFITIQEIREYLLKEIPEYIIPNKIEIIDKMPLLDNGKIDRKSLIKNFARDSQEHSETKGFEIENLVADLWKKTLNIHEVNTESDFFAEGGDSLLLMQLFMDLEEFIIKLPKIASFYKKAKFYRLIELINEFPENKKENLITNNSLSSDLNQDLIIPKVKTFPLSPAQTGFYFSHKYLNGDNSYWTSKFYLKGKLDIDLWKESLEVLQSRHQMLNVQLIHENPPNFQYLDNAKLYFEYHDLSNKSDKNNLIDSNISQFNLNEGYPLIKHKLYKIAENEFIWNVTAHHILADGLSSLIFGKEQFVVYNQLFNKQEINLPVLKKQFSDYTLYLKEQLQKNSYKDNLYWLKVFNTVYQEPKLTIISENKDFFSLKKTLSDKLWQKVIKQTQKHASTPFIILLTAYYQTLVKYTKQNDIVIGVANHGRDYPIPDIQNIFGCFAQAMPLRINQPIETNDIEKVNDIFRESLNHSLNITEIIKRIKPGTKLKSLLGSQFFFSFLDYSLWQTTLNNQSIDIDWSKSETIFQPGNNDNDIFLTLKKINKNVELNISFNHYYFNQENALEIMDIFIQELENIVNQTINSEKKITNQLNIVNEPFKISKNNKIDSLLIAYLPSLKSLPVSYDIAQNIKKQLFNNQNILWAETVKTSLGNTATLLLPFFAEEIIPANNKIITEYIQEAFKLSNTMKVKYISLAGMLPSVTGFGTKMLTDSSLKITTGHSCTVAAVIKTLQKILKETQLNLTESTIAFVGLGSIGKAVLYTMLSLNIKPKNIILSDLFTSIKQLEDIEQFIVKEFNFKGKITTFMNNSELPDEVYNTNIIISAVSKPNVIDIDKLKAGTIVIDDSFPYCFDTSKAIKRIQNKKDILVTGGGLLKVDTYQRVLYFPQSINQSISKLIAKSFINNTLASCQFESLLLSKVNGLKVTNGLADYKQVKDYINTLNKLDIESAPFHIGQETINQEILEFFYSMTEK